MKKFFLASCFLLVTSYFSYSQLLWQPVYDTAYGWNSYIDGGPVRVLYPDPYPSIGGGEEKTLYIGGEFDSIRHDSTNNVWLFGPWWPPQHMSPFAKLMWSPLYDYSLLNGEMCVVAPLPNDPNALHPSVWSVAKMWDTTAGGYWIFCAGMFEYMDCGGGPEDDAHNIGFSHGTMWQNTGYMPVWSFTNMDTVFSIAISKSLWNATCHPDMKTYVAAKCVFCNSMATGSDSARYIGYFTLCQGNYVYTFNYMQGGTNGPVYSIALIDTANVYAGGRFDSAGVIQANNIAKWNGASWDSLGAGVNGVVKALLAYNGKLYAGGNFTMAGGVSANNIAVWDGVQWSAIGIGTNGTVYALTIHNGELYAGGAFTQAGGNTVNNVAKWDGTNWSVLDGGRNNDVYALASFQGDLYAGGNFLGGANDTARYIARYTDTTLASVNYQSSILNSSITIYPNPTTGMFNVKWLMANGNTSTINHQPLTIEVYNVFGELVYALNHPFTQSLINLSEQPDGIYFVRINTSEGIVSKKVVVMR